MTLNLVRKAGQGDKVSLAAVIRSIQGRLYGLAIRMRTRKTQSKKSSRRIKRR